MMSARPIKRFAVVLLGALLFAQAALAVAACDWLRVSPAQAIMAKAGEPSCHEDQAKYANLCLSHCLGNDQSAGTPQIAVPAWNRSSLLVIADIELAPAPRIALSYTLPYPGAPPPRILYHSFLI